MFNSLGEEWCLDVFGEWKCLWLVSVTLGVYSFLDCGGVVFIFQSNHKVFINNIRITKS